MTLALTLAALILPAPHHHHKKHRRPPTYPALASWYDDTGQTASGVHYTYGFASLMFGSQWGKRIRFCHLARCVIGMMDDHGPYIGGRSFDFNAALKNALACSDLCYVRWSY